MPINVMVSDQFSSFLEPDHERVKDYAQPNVPCHAETVAVRTLDVVLPVLHERIAFDTTGVYPVSLDSALRLVGVDCVMINRAAA